jgi:hypothetical protein
VNVAVQGEVAPHGRSTVPLMIGWWAAADPTPMNNEVTTAVATTRVRTTGPRDVSVNMTVNLLNDSAGVRKGLMKIWTARG